MCSATQCSCDGVTFHQRCTVALKIICGTRSPQISACSREGIRKFCSAPASAYGNDASEPTSRPPALAVQPVPNTSVDFQVCTEPGIPTKSWLRTNRGFVYSTCAPGGA